LNNGLIENNGFVLIEVEDSEVLFFLSLLLNSCSPWLWKMVVWMVFNGGWW
jgi:hypothetical protein